MSPFIFIIIPFCSWTFLSLMGNERQRLKSTAPVKAAAEPPAKSSPNVAASTKTIQPAKSAPPPAAKAAANKADAPKAAPAKGR